MRGEDKKGPWTPEEDESLRELVTSHGPQRWSTVAESIPGRSGKSCRLRWWNHLSPQVKKGPFSQYEDAVIVRSHEKYGNKWSVIAKMLPGRTDNAVKNRWNSTLRRKHVASNLNNKYVDEGVDLESLLNEGEGKDLDSPSNDDSTYVSSRGAGQGESEGDEQTVGEDDEQEDSNEEGSGSPHQPQAAADKTDDVDWQLLMNNLDSDEASGDAWESSDWSSELPEAPEQLQAAWNGTGMKRACEQQLVPEHKRQCTLAASSRASCSSSFFSEACAADFDLNFMLQGVDSAEPIAHAHSANLNRQYYNQYAGSAPTACYLEATRGYYAPADPMAFLL